MVWFKRSENIFKPLTFAATKNAKYHCCQSKEGVLEKSWVLTRSSRESHMSRDSWIVVPGLVYKVWVYIQTSEICSDRKILYAILGVKLSTPRSFHLFLEALNCNLLVITVFLSKKTSGKLIYFTVVCQLRKIHFNQYSVRVKCCNMFKTCSKPIERLCK